MQNQRVKNIVRYEISRDGVTVEASAEEVKFIEASNPRWIEAMDVPDGVEFAPVRFGGVSFTAWRTQDFWVRHKTAKGKA